MRPTRHQICVSQVQRSRSAQHAIAAIGHENVQPKIWWQRCRTMAFEHSTSGPMLGMSRRIPLAHQCEKSLARRAAGHCVLCGKDDHWYKKCKLHNPAIHWSKLRNPCRPGGATGPQRSEMMWCLRHGQTGHSTATCDISSAPILMPPDELKEKFENVCLWCNRYGHTMT